MGDKFYNVQLSNTEDEAIRFETSQTSFQPVLDRPTEYSVGLKRFKLPLGSIDPIRVYAGECFLGFNYDHTSYNGDQTTVGDAQAVRLFDLTLCRGHLTAPHKRDPITGELYERFQSAYEFVEALNATLQLAISHSFYRAVGYITTGYDASTGGYVPPVQIPESTIGVVDFEFYQRGLTHVLQNATAPVYSTGTFAPFSVGRGANATPTTSDVPSYNSRKLLDIKITYANFGVNQGRDLYFSSIEYYLAVVMPGLGASANVLKNFCVFKGAFPGLKLSQMSTYFPHGFGISMSSCLDPRTYDWKSSPVPTAMVFFRPHELGRMRDELLLSFAEYNLYALNATTRINEGVPPALPTQLNYDLGITMLYTNAPYWVRGEGAFGQSNSTVSSSLTAFGAGDMIQAMPQFGWNSSEQKITLAVSEKMAGNGINFYVSEGLRKMLDLDNGRVFPGIVETATVGFQGSNYTISNPPVYELLLNTASGSYTLPAVLTGASAEMLNVYTESQSTVFAREFLYGLQILSNSLSIEGEFAGDGRERVKILSDFEVDPSSLAGARDFLLYQPSGDSVRFFDMQSDTPLSIIELRILFVSRQGHAYPLMLSPGSVGTVKIQFRKK